MAKCNQANCENEGAHRFTWPGRDEAEICDPCLPKLRNTAAAMGLYIQVRPIEKAPPDPSCSRCQGCGQVADDEEGAPWSDWTSLPPGADIAVKMGIVKPKPCPKCCGVSP